MPGLDLQIPLKMSASARRFRFLLNTMAHRRTIQTNSTLNFYKKEAKKLLKQYRNGNPEALELFEGFHPEKTTLEYHPIFHNYSRKKKV